jgi:hypothetical protein
MPHPRRYHSVRRHCSILSGIGEHRHEGSPTKRMLVVVPPLMSVHITNRILAPPLARADFGPPILSALLCGGMDSYVQTRVTCFCLWVAENLAIRASTKRTLKNSVRPLRTSRRILVLTIEAARNQVRIDWDDDGCRAAILRLILCLKLPQRKVDAGIDAWYWTMAKSMTVSGR